MIRIAKGKFGAAMKMVGLKRLLGVSSLDGRTRFVIDRWEDRAVEWPRILGHNEDIYGRFSDLVVFLNVD